MWSDLGNIFNFQYFPRSEQRRASVASIFIWPGMKFFNIFMWSNGSKSIRHFRVDRVAQSVVCLTQEPVRSRIQLLAKFCALCTAWLTANRRP